MKSELLWPGLQFLPGPYYRKRKQRFMLSAYITSNLVLIDQIKDADREQTKVGSVQYLLRTFENSSKHAGFDAAYADS